MDLVFVDANILHSKTLRDWTLLLGLHCGRFGVVSSEDCVIEALASIRDKNRHLDGGAIHTIGEQIKGSLHDLITDWPGGEVEGMPDTKDWHVVNAATHAGVQILMTTNTKDFSPIADSLPFDIYTPDELFTLIADNDPPAVEEVTRRQRSYWEEKRQKSILSGMGEPKRLAEALRDAGASDFADVVGPDPPQARRSAGRRTLPAPHTGPTHAGAPGDLGGHRAVAARTCRSHEVGIESARRPGNPVGQEEITAGASHRAPYAGSRCGRGIIWWRSCLPGRPHRVRVQLHMGKRSPGVIRWRDRTHVGSAGGATADTRHPLGSFGGGAARIWAHLVATRSLRAYGVRYPVPTAGHAGDAGNAD